MHHLKARMRAENRVTVDIAESLEKLDLKMEESLARVESKIDKIQQDMNHKAERVDLKELEDKVDEVRRNGSGHAQDALRRLTENESRISALERDQASKDAVEEALRAIASQQRATKYFWLGLAVTVGIALFGNFIGLAAIVVNLVHYAK